MNLKILDKLKKLVSVAEGERAIGNTAAADTFDEQIQVLLKKHRLSMEQVQTHAIQTDDIGLSVAGRFQKRDWHAALQGVIGMANQSFGLYSPEGDFAFVGVKVERDMAARQFKHFVEMFDAMGRAYKPSQTYATAQVYATGSSISYTTYMPPPPADMQRNSYVCGLVQGFMTKVMRDLAEKQFGDSEQEGSSTGLVYIERKQKKMEDYLRNKMKMDFDPSKPPPPPPPVEVFLPSFEEGIEAGENIALTDLTLDSATEELPA